MSSKLALSYITFDTPIGWLVVAESAEGIALVDFLGPDRPTEDALISTVLRDYPDTRALTGGRLGVASENKSIYSCIPHKEGAASQDAVGFKKRDPL